MNVADKLSMIRAACEQLRGSEYCTDTVVQGIAAVARHETGFGTYFPFAKKDGFVSHNWGAQQCSTIAKAGQCPAGCFPATDTSPTATGASIPYLACFQVNATEQAGALSLTRLLTVQRPEIAVALPSGDAQVIAQAMRNARYYEGFGATQEERVKNYAVALERNAKINAKQASVPNLVVLPPPPPPPPPPTGEEYGVLLAIGVAALAAALKTLLPPKPSAD
jgi:hypothetical protein